MERAGVAPDVTLGFTTSNTSECAGERTTLALKPMGRVTQRPKYGQSVAPQNEHWSNKNGC